MKKLHILGMAKSSLDLRGAKASKLELDFFKLAFAVEALRKSGDDAIGYLQVLAESVDLRAKGWVEKYSTGDRIKVILGVPSSEDLDKLAGEKARNALGLLAKGQIDEAEEALSLGSWGKELGESALSTYITATHVGVVSSPERPMSINWDYYGIVDQGN